MLAQNSVQMPKQDFTRSGKGLTSIEAARRLREFGFNEPVEVKRESSIKQFLVLFANPLMAILLVASAVSALVGEFVNSIIIVLMVLLGVILNFVQTARSQRAAESLRSEISPKAMALRDGEWRELPRREIVPGDIVQLTAGEIVPADCELFEAAHLYLHEAVLTGESAPVEKDLSESDKSKRKIFLGTSVVSGNAKAIVLATGSETAFGEIAKRLTQKPPETDFERGTRRFGYLIARVVAFLVIFVFFVNTFSHRDPLESLFFSIALAVGLTPEFLPMITAVTLAKGAVRMAKEKVIVRHLAAIQNFGSMDILCSDKTGTLTKGELTLEEHTNPLGDFCERTFFLAYLNSLHETGIANPIDRAIRKKTNPLDEAILMHDRPDVRAFQKLDEIPFDFERRRVSIVVESAAECILICKGAPESIFGICNSAEIEGRNEPFEKVSAKALKAFTDFSAKGFRVLAVAYKKVSRAKRFDQSDETDLIFAGFISFADQPLETAASTLRALASDGVQVKILTGDNELVTKHIAEKVGFDGGTIMLGEELESVSDAALGQIAESIRIFARVSPVQKNRILLALKSRGHVVGFLGDGINDAPSLRTADVGISVATAADVAKEAAEIVLMEGSLNVLHRGIIEGRKAYGNVMKYLLMGTSSNFGNMFSMAGATLFLPYLPMLPTQILLNNFLYDLAQVTIPTDRVDKTFIHKPHRWDVKLIRDFMLYIGPISSVYDFLTFFILVYFFKATEEFFHTGWFVESLATQTLVVFIIRTAGSPLKSRPSRSLSVTVIAIVAVGIVIPFSPVATLLGFVALPWTYFIFLLIAVVTYLFIVEFVKRKLMRRLIN